MTMNEKHIVGEAFEDLTNAEVATMTGAGAKVDDIPPFRFTVLTSQDLFDYYKLLHSIA